MADPISGASPTHRTLVIGNISDPPSSPTQSGERELAPFLAIRSTGTNASKVRSVVQTRKPNSACRNPPGEEGPCYSAESSEVPTCRNRPGLFVQGVYFAARRTQTFLLCVTQYVAWDSGRSEPLKLIALANFGGSATSICSV